MVEHFGWWLRQHRAGGRVQRLQLLCDFRLFRVAVLTDAAVRPKRRDAHRDVLGASLGEGWPEACALGDKDGLASLRREAASLKLAVNPPLDHADPLVVVQRQPRLGSRLCDPDDRNGELVVLGSYVARVLVDVELWRLDHTHSGADHSHHHVGFSEVSSVKEKRRKTIGDDFMRNSRLPLCAARLQSNSPGGVVARRLASAGRAASRAAIASRQRSSCHGNATTCTPTGRPAEPAAAALALAERVSEKPDE
mmetsp:Transcript_22636/g.64414  ORF Transcript_22636/g.64414 Transcript_22636/m.64414 type:complete len:252 (-) Transcript_22636:1657-2412(-)